MQSRYRRPPSVCVSLSRRPFILQSYSSLPARRINPPSRSASCRTSICAFLRAVLSAQEAFHSLFLLFIRRGSTCQHSLEDLIFFIPASVICDENFVHKIHPVIPACRLQKFLISSGNTLSMTASFFFRATVGFMSRSGSCGTASNISRVFLTLSSGIFSSKRTFPYETAVEEQRIHYLSALGHCPHLLLSGTGRTGPGSPFHPHCR